MGGVIDMSSCNCCITECPEFSDSFDRADSTNLGIDWTETAGSWEISGNALTTSNSNAEVKCTSLTGTADVRVKIKGTNNGDIIYLRYSSPSLFSLFIKFGPSGYIGQQNSSTSEFTALVNITTGVFHEIRWLCGIIYLDGVMIINLGDFYSSAAASATLGSIILGTDAITGPVYFDTLDAFQRHSPDASPPDIVPATCGICQTCAWVMLQGIKDSLTVIISGATNADPSWPNLANINGTYEVDHCGGLSTCLYYLSVNIDVDGNPLNNIRHILVEIDNFVSSSQTGGITIDLFPNYDSGGTCNGVCVDAAGGGICRTALSNAIILSPIRYGDSLGAVPKIANLFTMNPITVPANGATLVPIGSSTLGYS